MIVLITGFGPYDLGYDSAAVNESWECIRRLNKEEIENKYGIHLVIEQMSVDYNEVQEKTSMLWSHRQFDLAIHVGLHKDKTCLIKLERQARRDDYFCGDCWGYYPKSIKHPWEGMERYNTGLDLETIKDSFNVESPEQLEVMISEDAGKFLCEYIYYLSLHHSESKKVLFVHVPHKKHTYDQLARGLERLLELTLSVSTEFTCDPFQQQIQNFW